AAGAPGRAAAAACEAVRRGLAGRPVARSRRVARGGTIAARYPGARDHTAPRAIPCKPMLFSSPDYPVFLIAVFFLYALARWGGTRFAWARIAVMVLLGDVVFMLVAKDPDTL